MTDLLQHVLDGLSLGSVYALLSLGVSLIFGVMRLINLAHGELITVAAYSLYLAAVLSTPVALVISVAVVIVLALLMDRLAFRPVRGADPTTLLVTSFAVSFFLQNAIVLAFGATPLSVNVLPGLSRAIGVAGLRATWLDVTSIGGAILVVALLTVFFQRTRVGVRMRAASEDFEMARLLGVRADRVIAVAFGVSGVLAALACVLLLARTGTVTPTLGSSVVLFAFVATVVGGMGSLRGAAVAGFLLGLISAFLTAYLPLELRYFRDAFLFVAVVVLLLVRPQGLVLSSSSTPRVG